ncbi:helix-turn-helix domain-containing protein [Nonomuraea sp. NPDC051191]|uniref:helix-turn-helix domain-containing protein n=1 Tax=Nonomuraea sp. NPDC051191 TaxID=3364372 RepID=UPI0037876D5E
MVVFRGSWTKKTRGKSPQGAGCAAVEPVARTARASRMTQMELAVRAQVSEATVRKIEQGKVVEPGFFLVMALLSALGATPEALN